MKERLLAAGGVLGAVAASTCCIAPLALVSVGVSGAWIGKLTALAPYQPLFLALAAVCLGAGFWLVYRPGARECATGGPGRAVARILWIKGALWAGAALAAVSAGVDYGARLLS